jgi:hypothetical protein
VDEELFRTWLSGWSACRGDDGRTASVILTDQSDHIEHFLLEPDLDLVFEVVGEIREDPLLLLTAVTNRLPELLGAAGPLGMSGTDRQQSLMSAEMLGQEV